MEDRYADDTVELIDYLRVMWWGKWIILGCLVVAVGMSFLFVSLKSTTYSGALEFSFREYVTPIVAECEEAGLLQISIGQSAPADPVLALLESVIPGVTVSLADNRITLSRGNSISADAVRETLAQTTVDLELQIALIMADEFAHIERAARIREASLSMQLDILKRELDEERGTQEPVVLAALAEEVAALRARIAQQQALLELLGTANPADLFTLSSIGEPNITSSEPRGKTTIAVAAFLGLMLGTLLAFFVHYLIQIRERERQLANEKSAS